MLVRSLAASRKQYCSSIPTDHDAVRGIIQAPGSWINPDFGEWLPFLTQSLQRYVIASSSGPHNVANVHRCGEVNTGDLLADWYHCVISPH